MLLVEPQEIDLFRRETREDFDETFDAIKETARQ